MPVVIKISHDDLGLDRRKVKSQRQIVTEIYDTMLEGFNPLDWGEVKLDLDENRVTVRNRLKAAAQRRGLSIRFKRSKGDRMRFEVDTIEATSPDSGKTDDDAEFVPSPNDEAASNESRRGPGRPPKVRH